MASLDKTTEGIMNLCMTTDNGTVKHYYRTEEDSKRDDKRTGSVDNEVSNYLFCCNNVGGENPDLATLKARIQAQLVCVERALEFLKKFQNEVDRQLLAAEKSKIEKMRDGMNPENQQALVLSILEGMDPEAKAALLASLKNTEE